MSTTKEINSLAGIKERQTEVRKEIEMSQNAIVNQLKATADDAKDFALNDVLLPAAGIAAGAYVFTKVVKYAFRSKPSGSAANHVSIPVVSESDSASYNVTADTAASAQFSTPRGSSIPASTTSSSAPVSGASASATPVTIPVRVETSSKKESAWIGSLLSLGALLVPAGKAILEVIQNERK